MGDRLRIISAIFVSFILVVTYQNCGSGEFSVPSAKKSSTSTGGGGGGGAGALDGVTPRIISFSTAPALVQGKLPSGGSVTFSAILESAIPFVGNNYVWESKCGSAASAYSTTQNLVVSGCTASQLFVKATIYNGALSGSYETTFAIVGGAVVITDIIASELAGDATKLPYGHNITFTPDPVFAETYVWSAVCGAKTFSAATVDTSQCNSSDSLSVTATIVGKAVKNKVFTFVVGGGEVAPTIALQPVNMSIDVGSALEGSVLANGTHLGFLWYVKKSGDSQFTSLNSSYVLAPTSVSGGTQSKFSIGNADSSWNAAQFYVIVLNTVNQSNVTSNTVTATVNSTFTPRIVTDLNASYSKGVGSSISFVIVADGHSSIKPLAYEWYNCSNVKYSDSVNSATYTWPSLTMAQNGKQVKAKVIGTNGTAAFSACATVYVSDVPAITGQPSMTSVSPGATASFTVTASGATSYKWYQNTVAMTNGTGTFGQVVSGATSATLTIANAQTGMSGYSYNVEAINSAGSVMSNAVLLYVQDSCSEAARVQCEDNCDYNKYDSCTLKTNTTTGACFCSRKIITNPCGVSAPGSDSQHLQLEVYNPCGQ